MTEHHRQMEHPADDPMDARLQAWLDDPKAPTRPEPEGGAQAPAVGTIAMRDAVERALAHPDCMPPHPDTRPVLLQVTGNDQVTTLQTVEPGQPLGCIVGELGNDERVLYVVPFGYAKEYPPLPNRLTENDEPEVTENEGVIVTSEAPGLRATWLAPIDETPDNQPRHLRPRRRWWNRRAA